MERTVAQELLTKLQAQHGGCTLYQLHKILGVTTQSIYRMSNGQMSMATDTILIACDVLGEDSRPWIVRAELERCKSPERRQILKHILEAFDCPESRAAVGFMAFLVVGFFFGY